MPRHALLYLSPGGLACYPDSKASTLPAHHFGTGEVGLQAFRKWLCGAAKNTRMSLLIDLPDEAFQLESIPFVRGPDRRRLLERRCTQLFPDTPWVTHLSLGREANGRRDERILIAAITRAAAMTPWLAEIESAERSLGSVISVAFLSMKLAAELPACEAPLLLAHFTPAGLRVSCFEKGQLRFSRLSPAETDSATSPPRRLREEVQRTYQHLIGQRILSRHTPSTCFVLCPSGEAAELLTETAGSLELRFASWNPGQGAAAAPFDPSRSSPTSCLPLLLQILACRPRLPQFSPPAALRLQRIQRIRFAMVAVGALGLSLGLGLTMLNLLDLRSLQQQTAVTLSHLKAQEQSLLRLLAATPATPRPLEQLHATVARASALGATAGGPEAALRRLARALDNLPRVELQQIEWTVVEASDSPLQDRRAQPADAPVDVLVVHFILPTGPDQARERVSEATEILGALQRIPAAVLVVEHMPIEMNTGQRFHASDLQAEAEAPRLIARIQIPHIRP